MARPRQNLTGKVFGKLTAVKYIPGKPRSKWRCQCECGGVHLAETADLNRGYVKSCGCLRKKTKRLDDRKETVFDYVATSDGISVSEIGLYMDFSHSAIHSVLVALELKDLVYREKKGGAWHWFVKIKEPNIADNMFNAFCF